MREHDWRVRWRDRVLSLFLAAVMVFTLMPGNALTVEAAAEDEVYYVGDALIKDGEGHVTGDHPVTGEKDVWEWDGITNTLTFNSSWISPNPDNRACIILPADSTIVLKNGVDVLVVGEAGIHGKGNLTIVGNGQMRVHANRKSADGKLGHESVIICDGQLVIGDGETRPYLYTAVNDSGVSDRVFTLTSEDLTGESNPVVEMKSGQVTFSTNINAATKGKIWTASGTDGYVKLSGSAVLLDPSVDETNNEAKQTVCDNCTLIYGKAGTLVGKGYFFGSNQDYRFVYYDGATRNLPLRIPVGSKLDLTVAPDPKMSAGKIFLGWSMDKNATEPEEEIEVTRQKIENGAYTSEELTSEKVVEDGGSDTGIPIYLYPVYKDMFKKPDPNVNYRDKKLTDLDPGQYRITFNGKSIVASEEFVTVDASKELLIPNLSDYYGEQIVIQQVENDGEGPGYSEEKELDILNRESGPAKGDFGIENGEEKSTIKTTIDTVSQPLEYSIDSGDTWHDVDGEITVEDNAGTKVLIRYSATEDAPESQSYELTTLKKEAQPNVKVDYINEKLTGFNAGADYTINNGKPFTADEKGVAIEENYYGNNISIVKKGDGKTTDDSEEQSFTINLRPNAPEKKDFTVEPGKEKSTIKTTIDTTARPLEYREDGTEWKTVENNTITVEAGKSVTVRYKAIEDVAPASKILTLEAAKLEPEQEKTPTATVDYKREKLKDLVLGADYIIDGEDVTADENGEIDIDIAEDDYGKRNISVIKKGIGDKEDSEKQTLEIVERPKAPEKKDFTVEAGEEESTIKITINTTTKPLEYNVDGTEWETVKDNTITVEAGQDVMVRYEVTVDAPASKTLTLTKEELKLPPEARPNVKVDYKKEKLKGFEPNKDYTIDGKDVTADENGEIDAEEYYGETITIIKKGDGKTTTDSPEQTLTINPRPEAPSEDEFEVENGEDKSTIKGIDKNKEYSTDGGKTWTDGTDDGNVEVDAGDKVLVRDKATEDKPASDPVELTTKKLDSETTPNATVDYTTEKLKDLVPGADYTIDGKEVKADTKGEIDIAGDYYGKTISIVKKGDGTTTDSAEQKLTISPRPTAPSDKDFTVENGETESTIKGIGEDQEYSTDGGTNWNPGPGKDKEVKVPAGTTVLIRDKAKDDKPASDSVKLTTQKVPSNPPASSGVTGYESADVVEQQILNANTDKGDPAGTTFGTLRLKATGKNKSVKLTWKKVKDADGYIIYGSRCGVKMKKIKTVKGASKKSYTQKKLKKGKYYKYIVVAYKTINGKDYIITKSKSAHAATTGGKNGNPKKVSVKSAKVQLKKGRAKKIKASYVSSKKVKVHIAKFRYESSNKDVATVDKKGKIKAKEKGKATIYVYAQNGVYKTVKVTVK